MPNIPIKVLQETCSLEELCEVVAKLQKQVNYLQNKNVDSENVFEVGGWRVTVEQIASKDGDVGMSTTDSGADDIRFWAGDAKDGAPKFVVTKGGILTAVDGDFAGKITADEGTIGGFTITATALTAISGGKIQNHSSSADKVYLDDTGFHANDSSGVERLTIGTTPAEGAKALIGRDSSGTQQSVYAYDTEVLGTGQYITAHGCTILLKDDGSILIQDGGGRGFRIDTGYPEMNNGFGWVTIAKQSDLTSKANLGSSTSTNGYHDHGIDFGVKLATTSDGSTVDGYVTWVPSGSHSHTQT